MGGQTEQGDSRHVDDSFAVIKWGRLKLCQGADWAAICITCWAAQPAGSWPSWDPGPAPPCAFVKAKLFVNSLEQSAKQPGNQLSNYANQTAKAEHGGASHKFSKRKQRQEQEHSRDRGRNRARGKSSGSSSRLDRQNRQDKQKAAPAKINRQLLMQARRGCGRQDRGKRLTVAFHAAKHARWCSWNFIYCINLKPLGK